MRFADIDPETLNIDPDTIEPCLTPTPQAIYLVHLSGNPEDLDAVRAVASAHGLAVVEDCEIDAVIGALADGMPKCKQWSIPGAASGGTRRGCRDERTTEPPAHVEGSYG